MSDLIDRARAFAYERHAEQKRKYTGEPYTVHLEGVAGLVSSVLHTEAMVAAALLHDVVEDTPTSLLTVVEQFGPEVGQLVFWLTDSSKATDGNRKQRKWIDLLRLSWAPADAQTIKLADLIDNTASIVEYDKDFARVYLDEKADLLKVLFLGSTVLYTLAQETLEKGQRALVQDDLRKMEAREGR